MTSSLSCSVCRILSVHAHDFSAMTRRSICVISPLILCCVEGIIKSFVAGGLKEEMLKSTYLLPFLFQGTRDLSMRIYFIAFGNHYSTERYVYSLDDALESRDLFDLYYKEYDSNSDINSVFTSGVAPTQKWTSLSF